MLSLTFVVFFTLLCSCWNFDAPPVLISSEVTRKTYRCPFSDLSVLSEYKVQLCQFTKCCSVWERSLCLVKEEIGCVSERSCVLDFFFF